MGKSQTPAPFVPKPVGPSLPVTDLRPILGHMRHGGTTLYIPDTCPIASRDELRHTLEEILRSRRAPDRLAEWFRMVRSANVDKEPPVKSGSAASKPQPGKTRPSNLIPRYGRIFEVQHYVRALYARHEAALRRKKSALTPLLRALPKKGPWLFTAPPSRKYPQGGHWINTKHLNEDFLELLTKLGIKAGRKSGGFSIHSLRNSFETICVNAGIPQRVVDTWLGHRSDKSTASIYYKLSDENSQEFMLKVPLGIGKPAADAGTT